ncbi:chorion class CA protein ERA.1-like [Cydia amplana]|uniref:chorion class CA protein ERA.1-like n=1 Tax=Cydia amplana TaxID=1869771 RepID=UPI002FE5D29B
MSRFAVLLLCVQAFLIQAAFSQQQCGCNQNYGQYSSTVSAPISYATSASYGGTGTGQVGVSGDIGASGTTCVVGSVPVLGSVDFGGKVAAAGSVSISGQCGCGCKA